MMRGMNDIWEEVRWRRRIPFLAMILWWILTAAWFEISASIEVSPVYGLVPLSVSWFILSLWSLNVHCPRCGKSFFFKQIFYGMNYGNAWTRSCMNCRARIGT
jgi:hypothetical protein